MYTHRQKLLLAIKIREWDTALSHIRTIEAVSVEHGHTRPYGALSRVQQELRHCLNEWSAVTERLLRLPDDDARMIEEASAYLAQHQAEVERLTLTPVREDN